VAFVDVRMPGIDGIELTREVAKKGVMTTVILMSAYGSVEDAKDAIGAGAYDYITKPFKTDEVVLTLTKAEERESLRRENVRLKAVMVEKSSHDGMVFKSKPMREIFSLIEKVARVDSTALIIGESGTGKELVARAIHVKSSRSERPLVAVNCAAIPENLIESELFGHRKGAFTDANNDKKGIFLEADGGTLLLDEIGELPMRLQVKLLRVLQEGSFRPLGAHRDESVDVRIIAATVQNLEENVRDGTFREDLFYRLHVLPVKLPPLRERGEDILLLAEHFIKEHSGKPGTNIRGLSKEAEKLLMLHNWPGNVRELQNVIERAVVLAEGENITADSLPGSVKRNNDIIKSALDSDELSIKKTVRLVEEELIRRALKKTGGNRTAAAKLLEISHRALRESGALLCS